MAAEERRDADSWVNRDLVDAAEAGRDLFIFNGSETAAVDKHTHMCACIHSLPIRFVCNYAKIWNESPIIIKSSETIEYAVLRTYFRKHLKTMFSKLHFHPNSSASHHPNSRAFMGMISSLANMQICSMHIHARTHARADIYTENTDTQTHRRTDAQTHINTYTDQMDSGQIRMTQPPCSKYVDSVD